MLGTYRIRIFATLAMCAVLGWTCSPADAAVRISGQVQAGGGAVANSTVTLWAASSADPKQLAQTQTGNNGSFELSTDETLGADVSLYLVAKGGATTVNNSGGNNPAIALLTVLGNTPPANVVINEMTTVASVWTNAQFLDGTAIKGHALGLRIAAGNVPNFVDLQTGGWGVAIAGPAQQRPDADNGQLCYAGRPACGLHYPGECRCVQQPLHRGSRRRRGLRRPTR